MKTVMACLMCLLLGTSPCFAIDGGPDYGSGQVTTTGTYAGVLVPIPIVVDPGPPEVTLTDNSLALFTVTIPRVGLASGTSAVFRNGIFYPGTITGSADPDSAKLTAIVNAEFKVTSIETAEGDIAIEARYLANGKFDKARIVSNSNLSSTTSARIRGTASLTYTNDRTPIDPNGDSGGPIQYKVKGFKQAEAVR